MGVVGFTLRTVFFTDNCFSDDEGEEKIVPEYSFGLLVADHSSCFVVTIVLQSIIILQLLWIRLSGLFRLTINFKGTNLLDIL
jgi:hypothetical protein